ncbi:MAG: hypothetical protein HY233_03545 [Acidobacteriales bacterium]|nr:hypothetical protein [Terriglobales bacterium]
MSEKPRTQPSGDILIDSDWITTIGMALGFAVCVLLLGQNIRDFLFERVDHPVSLFYYAVDAVYSFFFAYSFRAKYVRVAFLLLGTQYAVRLALAYFHVAAGLQHPAALVGSIAKQISFIIILVAIAQWFKTVIRRDPPSDPGVSDS